MWKWSSEDGILTRRKFTEDIQKRMGERSIYKRSPVRIVAPRSKEKWKPNLFRVVGGGKWGEGMCENKLERLAVAILQKTHDSGLDPFRSWKLIQRDKGKYWYALIRLQRTEHSKDSLIKDHLLQNVLQISNWGTWLRSPPMLCTEFWLQNKAVWVTIYVLIHQVTNIQLQSQQQQKWKEKQHVLFKKFNELK